MERFIERILAGELAEVGARPEGRGRDAQSQRAEDSAMSIKRLIARVIDESARDRGEMDVAIAWQDKFGHQQMRQICLIEVVANLQTRVVPSTDETFDLKRSIAKSGGKQRIFGCAFYGKAGEGTPLRPDKVRLSIGR